MTRLLFQRIMLAAQPSSELPEGGILQFDSAFLIHIGILLINVVILTAALIFILYKPVKKFLTARTDRIKNEFESARKEREEAEELRGKYELMLSNIEKEREEVLREAHKKAAEKGDQILHEAQQEAAAFHQKALAELETERKNAESEICRQIIEISAAMAGRFVEVSIDKETQDKYIEEAFAQWEEG